MKQDLVRLVDRIREQYPGLDVRTDQCDIVRIITKKVLVGVRHEEIKYTADFISLEGKSDFETTLMATLVDTDIAIFEERLLKALATV